MGAFYSQRVKARTLGYLIIGVALVGLVIVAFPNAETVRDSEVVVLAGVTFVVGLAYVLGASRDMSSWVLHTGVVLGITLLALANHLLGPGALVPIMYTWMALYAFAFFRRAAAMGYMALIGLSYALVLTGQTVSSPVVRWLLCLGTPLVAGFLLAEVIRLAISRTEVLQESEEQTRAVIEAAPNAFFTIDCDGIVPVWNREAERMFGYPASEAIGRDIVDLIVLADDHDGHMQRRSRAFAMSPDDPPGRREQYLMRKGGERFYAEVTLSLVMVEERASLLVFVRDLSDRIARELERDELYREQSARQEAEHMASMVQGLQMLLDAALAHGRLEQMMEALLPRVCEVLSAEVATIYLTGEDGRLALSASTGGMPAEPLVLAPLQGIAGKVADTRAPLLVNDPEPGYIADPTMHSASSVIAVPLTAGETVTGVIQVGISAPRHFDDDALLLLGLAADRVVLAIEHAQVFEREHRIAETLQRSLLPERLPRLPGLTAAARYIPAATEAEVGGDWYDVIAIDSSRVGLVMGDVAGKGLAAASMVGSLRSAMRAYALEGHEPAEVVARLNQLLWTEVEDGEMATLVYVVIDPGNGEIAWVNAGHPPPLVLGPDAPSFLEGPRSVPLGVMPFPAYEAGTATLDGGSTLLLYTDGLVERPGELLDNGFERLAAAVADSDRGAEELCEHVLARLVPAGAMSDDVALLALHMPMLSERFSIELPSRPEELASMRALLRRWLRHADATEEDVAEILAATGEAAANAIEHSGKGGGGPFEVAGAVDGGEVAITVRDSGSWREKRSEGRGRGLVMMRQLMDAVDVTPSATGTTVQMRRKLRVPSHDVG